MDSYEKFAETCTKTTVTKDDSDALRIMFQAAKGPIAKLMKIMEDGEELIL